MDLSKMSTEEIYDYAEALQSQNQSLTIEVNELRKMAEEISDGKKGARGLAERTLHHLYGWRVIRGSR